MSPCSKARCWSSFGATIARSAAGAGTDTILVEDASAFGGGQAIVIGGNANFEKAVIRAVRFGRRGSEIVLAAPLKLAHVAGAQVSGTGITFTKPLALAHARGAQITSDLPTPGAPNKYATPPGG